MIKVTGKLEVFLYEPAKWVCNYGLFFFALRFTRIRFGDFFEKFSYALNFGAAKAQ